MTTAAKTAELDAAEADLREANRFISQGSIDRVLALVSAGALTIGLDTPGPQAIRPKRALTPAEAAELEAIGEAVYRETREGLAAAKANG